ncbi:TerB family tellurite resistance protein [Myxococcota bacterium]|nr:TerB family tellurite resistance protein [Myxococcota bacterium]
MSSLLRFLGIEKSEGHHGSEVSDPLDRIAGELDGLSPERGRFYACFAYVLARVAEADLRIEKNEIAAMERALIEVAGIPKEEAGIAIGIARSEVEALGGSLNYLVTQEFGQKSSTAEKLQLIECLYAVAAADDSVTGAENNDILSIAAELGLPRQDALAIRTRFKDKLAELRPLAGE